MQKTDIGHRVILKVRDKDKIGRMLTIDLGESSRIP